PALVRGVLVFLVLVRGGLLHDGVQRDVLVLALRDALGVLVGVVVVSEGKDEDLFFALVTLR
ncbi:hypothetical protein AAHH79_41660, partial [Burkholderia pseudomallei]